MAPCMTPLDCSRVFDEEGRFAPELADGSEKEIACDTVVFAIGQVADLSFLGDLGPLGGDRGGKSTASR